MNRNRLLSAKRAASFVRLSTAFLVGIVCGPFSGWASAAEGHATRAPAAAAPAVIQDFTSQHFVMRTDLPAKEAQDLLKKLENMFKLISGYWGRPPVGVLECYVAQDIDTWPEAVLGRMDPEGVEHIREGGGVCISHRSATATRFVAKATVYATAKDRVTQHEAVHGYCMHAFGRTGPQWYAEGMAELGQCWIRDEKGVNADRTVIRYLKAEPPATVGELIAKEEKIGGTWQDYAKWWSLCHLLENNPNYNRDFRKLGAAFLMGAPNQGFDFTFGGMSKELTFEYFFFLAHMDSGYRVDLTAWDWKKKAKPLAPRATASCTVEAARGWQPTGVAIAADVPYEISATGTWKTSKDGKAVDAAGAPDGAGRLVGTLMRDYKISQEFPLGAQGMLKFKVDGTLYVRCRDKWTELDDNSGKVALKIKIQSDDPPADKPPTKP